MFLLCEKFGQLIIDKTKILALQPQVYLEKGA